MGLWADRKKLSRWAIKYFDKIKAAEAWRDDLSIEAAFDFNDLGTDGFLAPLKRQVWLWSLRTAFAFFRTFWPVPRFFRLVLITRDCDVKKVLDHPDVFVVPYGREMKSLGRCTNNSDIFVLGLDGALQQSQHKLIHNVIDDGDLPWLIQRSRQIADTLLDNSEGQIDVMKDLITRVAAETCGEYFGLRLDDPDAFAEWSMAISALLFADPLGNAQTRALGMAGASRVLSVIDAGLARLASGRPPKPPEGLSGTILARLVASKASRAEIRSIMVGLVTGFIPTTTLAAGNIVEQLLQTRDGFAAVAPEAIAMRGGDQQARSKLEQKLFEAAQLNPALNPGQWRYAKTDGTVGGKHIKAGSILLVSTASAMRDAHNKTGYDLVFGHGLHACLGKWVAMAQITEILGALFAREKLRVSKNNKWHSISRIGVFPCRLDMEFGPVSGPRTLSMVTVLAPLAKQADLSAWRGAISELGNPATVDVDKAFKDAKLVHFASLNAIELGDVTSPAPHLLLELNGDGDDEALIAATDAHVGKWLAPLFRSAANGDLTPGNVESGPPLAELLKPHVKTLQARPWGTTGLNFFGLPAQSAASIERQDELAQFCRDALAFFVSIHASLGNRAAAALKFVRDLIRDDPAIVGRGDPRIASLLERGRAFRRDLLLPSRQAPPTLSWDEPQGRAEQLLQIVGATSLRPVYIVTLVLTLAIIVLCFCLLGFSLPHRWLNWRDWPAFVGQGLIAIVAGCLGTLSLYGILMIAFIHSLNQADEKDKPQDLGPDLAKVREIAEHENPLNFAQNHFLSVSPMKPGLFRKLTLGISLWGIELLVSRCFRPGFILDMGTIHFARWLRPPGTERLVFLSNYDGSWESYLEDFINKAHEGQSAAWSNAIGFPKTELLVNDGASDGDRFKRWVRRQQEVTRFWFNRFPHLTADQMRNNAVICWELARATTDSEARAWLSYFGSMPKTDTEIETTEVQSLVFRGFKHLDCMKFAAIRLPEDREACKEWLGSLVCSYNPHAPAAAPSNLQADPLPVTFGDRPALGEEEQCATFVAFSVSGLSHLGLPDAGEPNSVATFPTVFNLRMASRERVLGDSGDSAPAKWNWSDDGKSSLHAVLLLYARDQQGCQALLERHRKKLGSDSCIYELDTQPTELAKKSGKNYEHFGFRDGISQPVIRGTQRFARGALPRDVMAPGEFLLGYKSNQGYYPPTPVVDSETDVSNRLGSVPVADDSRYAAFQDTPVGVRDFGRNGTFLAIRQLQQHVENFHNYSADCVRRLQGIDGLPELIGGNITQKWVEAKMMGRWHDGVPLIDRPVEPTMPHAERPGEHVPGPHQEGNSEAHGRSSERSDKVKRHYATDTALDFGVDDPQGLFCPFGAHVRRVNPRGSLEPGDDSQLAITNRHRILRRGRSYQRGDEKGLLFIGLCADLERQYEFVQQSWLNAPGFAGLTNEPDPIIAVKQQAGSTRFTIPTTAGSLSLDGGDRFITVRGGGYFFLPSRSALMYLADG